MTNNLFINPYLRWTNLAFKAGEMMFASAQVIGHSTRRMAAAGAKPSARDRREFALMGQEKLEAAGLSAQAIARQMMRTNMQIGARAYQQLLAASTDLMALAASRTAGQSMARQAKLVRTMTSSGNTVARLSGAYASIAQRGLKPVHARATANARRLGKFRG